jgi:hypothetical protein
MKFRKKWVKIAGFFLLIFVLMFPLGLLLSFPSSSLKAWINTLNVPGKISVEKVRLDPLIRLYLNNFTWQFEENPIADSLVFKQIVVRPSWAKLLFGRKVFVLVSWIGKSELDGVFEEKKGRLIVSLTTLNPVDFPMPLKLKPGVALHGQWRLRTDLKLEPGKETGNVLGGCNLIVNNLLFRWNASPFGPIHLTFVSGSVEGNITRSVFNAGKIMFRGSALDVDGTAILWRDPLTGRMKAKGTLYFRPKLELETTNASLDTAIRLLPKDARGFRFAF